MAVSIAEEGGNACSETRSDFRNGWPESNSFFRYLSSRGWMQIEQGLEESKILCLIEEANAAKIKVGRDSSRWRSPFKLSSLMLDGAAGVAMRLAPPLASPVGFTRSAARAFRSVGLRQRLDVNFLQSPHPPPRPALARPFQVLQR